MIDIVSITFIIIVILIVVISLMILLNKPLKRPISDRMRWRVEAEGSSYIIKRPHNSQFISDGNHTARKRWYFDPTDDDSRADALVKAQDYCDGINHAHRQAEELNR
jgi:hypothetical protein